MDHIRVRGRLRTHRYLRKREGCEHGSVRLRNVGTAVWG